MRGRHTCPAMLVLALLCLALWSCPAEMVTADQGMWPDDWPEELEPLRERATTLAHNAVNIYQISFAGPEEFEKLWPIILGLKSKGGTLTLYGLGYGGPDWPETANEPGTVRILAPTGAILQMPEPGAEEIEDPPDGDIHKWVQAGKALRASPPWPETAYLPNGELAEYVTAEWRDGKLIWLPSELVDDAVLMQRARVDIELVVDGDVIDLNRIHMPADTRIIDKRGYPEPEPTE